MPSMTRALVVVRLSNLTDATTSPERQLEHCQSVINARGWTHVGTAEDLDVSATKYNPFQRPELGKWLTDTPPAEWDTLVVWRLDRLVRSSRDLSKLLEWCERTNRGFVSATEGFDLSTPFGKAMVAIIAALGELEADTTSTRVTDAHKALRQTDRLASGVPPFGFAPVPHPSGRGVTWVKDSDMQRVLHDMAGWLLDGWSLSRIAQKLRDDGVLTAKDRGRVRSGKAPKRDAWQTWLVKAYLTSPATQGYKMIGSAVKGSPALDKDGNMIRVTDPTFDDSTWEQIQEKIAERAASGKRRVHSSNPMLGVGVCGECGRGLGQNISTISGKKYRYYRCSRNPSRCPGVTIRAEQLEQLAESAFLLAEGDNYVREKVFIPGTDNRADIETTRSSLERLRAESDMGLITDENAYFNRLRHLTERLKELEKDPYRPSEWVDRETDQTYREAWADADPEGRRKLLQGASAQIRLYPNQRVEMDINATKPEI